MSHENLSSSESQPVATPGKGPSATLIGLAVLIALGVTFFFQNGKKTSIHFLFFQTDAKIRWAIIVAVLLGIAIDRIFTMWWRRRGKRTNN